MKITAILVSAFFLLADVVVARLSRRQECIARRQLTSRPIIRPSPTSVSELRTSDTNATRSEFSQNCAGIVIEGPPSGKFTSVTSTFVIPTLVSSEATFAWVGVDGYTATNSILQAGVDFEMDKGRRSYTAWLEWYPNYAVDMSNLPIMARETINIIVQATSSTYGTVILTNVSTGKSVTTSVKAPSSSVSLTLLRECLRSIHCRLQAALEGLNAEWIVEDLKSWSNLQTLALLHFLVLLLVLPPATPSVFPTDKSST